MASPQPPYGPPGPAAYFSHPPPAPHYLYGNHSPNPYQYQYPPPHMNNHPPVQSSPRMNGPAGRGSFIPQRGGLPYQNFHSGQYPHPHQSPLLAPQPHSPPSCYPPPGPAKYPPQYSPSYSASPPYPPSWPSQQLLSPMPKQLLMPPPPMSPSLPPPQHLYPSGSIPLSPRLLNDSRPTPSSPQSSVTTSSNPQQSYVGTIADAQKPSSLQVSSPARATSDKFKGGWVIWSRRPDDPSHAPGIIISPRARPPQDVIQNAIEMSTPPVSPSPSVVEELPAEDNLKGSVPSSPERTEVLSSTTTETTPACSTAPDTPMPGSPLSTNTSLSMTAASPSRGKSLSAPPQSPQVETVTPPKSEEKATAVEGPEIPAPSATSQTPVASMSALAPKTPLKSWASLLRPTETKTSSRSQNTLPTSSVVGISIPAADSSSKIPISPSKTHNLQALLTARPFESFSPPNVRSRGLVNTGNMCFANSVLQILIHCSPFYRLFTELGKYLTGPVVGTQKEGSKATPFVDATIQFLKEFQSEEVDPKAKGKDVDRGEGDGLQSFIPTYVYDAMKEKKRFDNMRGGHQEDAEEFLGFYLDALEEELLSLASAFSPSGHAASSKAAGSVEVREEEPPQEDGWMEVGKRNRMVITRTIKSAESPITRIFGGKFRSTLRAPQHKDSIMIEDWRALQLDIQREQIHTVKDALQCISIPSSVQLTSPTRPGVTLDASQQVLIDTLPPILVLHMKRFLYDTKVNGVVKISKQVSFGPELEIGSDIMPARKGLQPTKYKLFGVLYHHGLSASGGHYTLDVLHSSRDHNSKPRDSWIRIDDELVSNVRDKDVFEQVDRDDRCAYLLFYHRIGGPISTSRT